MKIAAIQGGKPPVHAEIGRFGTMKCGCGPVGGMVDASLILNALIFALLVVMLIRSHFKSEEVHHRLDDVIDGVGLFATEVLKRTESIMEMGRNLNPAIELHNHNPLEQIFRFVQGMKTGNFGDENITNPRNARGEYAPAPEIEISTETPSEIVDIID